MASMTVSEARAALPDLLTRVEGGEEVTLTRHGRAVAVVVRPDVLNTRRAPVALANGERIRELLATGRVSRLAGLAGLTAQRADELIQEIRAGRDRS
jgi:antitoxin (DNA-binding transcriptional repressor) of toxin-antitoxin stability system